MLKHLPRSGIDFLLHIFNHSWTLLSFPSISKTSSNIPIHKMGKSLDSPAFFRPISLTSCASKLFNASFYPVYFFFWNLIPFSLPARPVSTLDSILLIKFCSFLSPFRMGLTNPGRVFGRSFLLLIWRVDLWYRIWKLQKVEYSFSKLFVWHFSRESVRNEWKGEVSHLYRDTVDEKEKKREKKALSWLVKRSDQ